MKTFKNPSPKDLPKLLEKNWENEATVLHYTGHVFGIGCRLSAEKSRQQIIQLKQRSEKTGFIALIPDLQWLFDAEIHVPEALLPILNQYWPGNLTVVIPCLDERFAQIAVKGKVAFRVPTDEMLRHLIDLLDEPMISTSINRSGVPAATDLNEISKRYETWFDLGILPHPAAMKITDEPSTIIEYIDADDAGNPVKPFLKCLREGNVPYYEIKKSFADPSILFMCTGNICRSPIAEYLFNDYATRLKLPYSSKSAGLLETGSLISVNSMRLLAEQGINAQEHYSRKVNPEILGESWLVLTTEQRQKDYLQKNFPEAAHKIFTMKEYVGEEGDIEDPHGLDLEYYRTIYKQIDDNLQKLITKLTNKTIAGRK